MRPLRQRSDVVHRVLKRRLDDVQEVSRALRAYANDQPYIPSALFEMEASE